MPTEMKVQCCIAGGGPAGIMLGYLMARAGVDTVVLEKHKDFLRDFRGDTVHPSTTQIIQDLGLLEDFLKVPHQKVDRLGGDFDGEKVTLVDFSQLETPCPYIVFMPQWDFLNFIVEKGKILPRLKIVMEANVTALLHEGGRVVGVHAETPDGPMEVHAALTVGADGRSSTVRAAAGLAVEDQHAAIDVFWFRVEKSTDALEGVAMHSNGGKFLITIERQDYLQCAFVMEKGQAGAIHVRGLDAFRHDIATAAPELRASVNALVTWDDVKLLTVSVERLLEWSAPGILCIGDAAHTMSPVGGVGINLAVQDAVATANLLAVPLREGRLTDEMVDEVQARRLWPAKVVQNFQGVVQKNLLKPALAGRLSKMPLMLRLVSRSHWIQGKAAQFVGLGVRQERVESKPF